MAAPRPPARRHQATDCYKAKKEQPRDEVVTRPQRARTTVKAWAPQRLGSMSDLSPRLYASTRRDRRLPKRIDVLDLWLTTSACPGQATSKSGHSCTRCAFAVGEARSATSFSTSRSRNVRPKPSSSFSYREAAALFPCISLLLAVKAAAVAPYATPTVKAWPARCAAAAPTDRVPPQPAAPRARGRRSRRSPWLRAVEPPRPRRGARAPARSS